MTFNPGDNNLQCMYLDTLKGLFLVLKQLQANQQDVCVLRLESWLFITYAGHAATWVLAWEVEIKQFSWRLQNHDRLPAWTCSWWQASVCVSHCIICIEHLVACPAFGFPCSLILQTIFESYVKKCEVAYDFFPVIGNGFFLKHDFSWTTHSLILRFLFTMSAIVLSANFWTSHS